MHHRTFIFAAVLIATAAAASLQASPEPEFDSLAGPQLYVVPAGRSKYRSKHLGRVLSNDAKICPSTFKHGFSIHCDSDASHVSFYVNGSLVKKERSAPFYIRGNYGKVVVPWRSYPSHAEIECRAGRNQRVKRSVSFSC